MKNLNKALFLALAVSFILSACGQKTATNANQPTPVPAGAVVAEGHIKPVQGVTLAFQARGAVSQIMAKQGDQVREGDALVRLTDYDQAAAGLTTAQMELTAAQQAYDTLSRTSELGRAQAWKAYMDAQVARENAQKKWDGLNLRDIRQRIDSAQATVNDRKKELEDAQIDFNKYKDLGPDNSSYKDAEDKLKNKQQAYDEAVTNLESVQRERDVPRATLDAALAAEAEAKYQYDLTTNGANSDQLAAAKARLDNAKAQVTSAQEATDNYELKAPFDGVVADVSVHIGDQVGPETPAVSVADLNQWYVETTDVTELEVVKLAVGQTATLIPDALPEVSMTGVVDSISQAYTQQGGDILYAVRLRVDKVDPRVRWGMTVEATFPPLTDQ